MTAIAPKYDYFTGERVAGDQSSNWWRQQRDDRYYYWKNAHDLTTDDANADISRRTKHDMSLQPPELELFRSKLERDRTAAIEKEREERERPEREERERSDAMARNARKRGKKNARSKWIKKKKRD